MNTAGWVGLAISHTAAIAFGACMVLLILDPWRKKEPKYKHRYKPRPVPTQEQEWSVTGTSNEKLKSKDYFAQPVTPSEIFESVCRKIVEENPEKFETLPK